MTDQPATPRPKIGAAIDELVATLEKFDEKQRQTILIAVGSLLQLNLGQPAAPVVAAAPVLPAAAAAMPAAPGNAFGTPQPKEGGLDIRTLKDQKDPATAQQMACIVAYYLLEHAPADERKDTINATDVERYFKQAKFKLPKNIEQLLVDVKRAGFFDTAARGLYKLTRVGYNLVTHSLPAKTKA